MGLGLKGLQVLGLRVQGLVWDSTEGRLEGCPRTKTEARLSRTSFSRSMVDAPGWGL